MRLCKQLSELPNEMLVVEAWATVLGVERTDRPRLLQRLALANTLIDQTEARIRSLPDINLTLFLTWQGPVRTAFGQLNLVKGTLAQMKTSFTAEVLHSLEHCHDRLRREAPDSALNQRELESILTEVQTLMTNVLESELPPEIRSFLLEKLDSLERAMSMYSVTGIKPVEDAVDSIFGGTIRKGGEEFYKDVKGTECGGRFWKLSSRAATLVTFAESGFKLLGFMMD